MQLTAVIEQIELKYRSLSALMDERLRRQWAAAEAQAYGWGGIRAVCRATGLSPNTISQGHGGADAARGGLGAGSAAQARRGTQAAHRSRSGVADRAWKSWSIRSPAAIRSRRCAGPARARAQLAEELTRQGHPVEPRTVAPSCCRQLGYSLQANRKTQGRRRASGSQRPVRAHQRHGAGCSSARTSR